MNRFIYVFIVLVTLTGFRPSPERIISGKITDKQDRQAIPGVAVLAGKRITHTDADGRYTIRVTATVDTLQFISVGYTTRRISIRARKTANVELQASTVQLPEVAVIGPPRPATRSSVTACVASAFGGTGAPNSSAESYAPIDENKFHDPVADPLSTFAADVDAASYSNVRRYINSGQLPPKDAVRIEEMINYFHYDLDGPRNDDPIAIHTEITTAPWNDKHLLLRIGLQARTVDTKDLPPSNLVFLVDVSGSMNEPNKLPLVKSSMKLLIDQLRPQDRVALVTYAGSTRVVLGSTPGGEKMKLKAAIDQLDAEGSTAGAAGLRLAYGIARETFLQNGNNRIILATDGDFNIGPSSDKNMEELIEQERDSGVSISILGFGMGNYKDSKMELLADKGHGNYAYIDNMTEARKAMVSEFGGTLFTIAKDVKLQVEFNPARAARYRLLGYENRLLANEDFNNDHKLGGDMGVGHSVTALYEIIPVGVKDDFADVDTLKYHQERPRRNLHASAEWATVKFRYKHPRSGKSKLVSAVVTGVPTAIDAASTDLRFASAVAELGLLLRNSEFRQQASYRRLVERAKTSMGVDDEGYRAEFVRLAQTAQGMAESKER